jgi:hypothetical protein
MVQDEINGPALVGQGVSGGVNESRLADNNVALEFFGPFQEMLEARALDAVSDGGDVSVFGGETLDAKIPGLIEAGRMVQEPDAGMVQAGAKEFECAVMGIAVHHHDFVRQIKPGPE